MNGNFANFDSWCHFDLKFPVDFIINYIVNNGVDLDDISNYHYFTTHLDSNFIIAIIAVNYY